MTRPLTRSLLASAIEYAAQSKLSMQEQNRFFVNHYPDDLMEDARREAVGLLYKIDPRSIPQTIKQQLCEIAQRLRNADSTSPK